jgi:hypothetical protein
LAPAREFSPLARLIHALREEKIRFQIAGMSGAILQGVPATTLDTDIWVDLPSRQYMRVINLCLRLGATPRVNTVVDLSDGSTVNFLYEAHGLRRLCTSIIAPEGEMAGMIVAVLSWSESTRVRSLSDAPRTSLTCRCWSRS